MPESEAPAPEATDPATPEASTPKTFDEAYVGTLRKESAGYRTRAKELESALEAANTALTEAKANTPALSSRAETAELQVARLTVALEKGLPANLVPRLVGTTPEELAADADALVAALSPAPTSPLGHGPQGSTEQPAQKPDVNAALRRLAQGK